VRLIVIGALTVFIVAVAFVVTQERANWDLLAAARMVPSTVSGSSAPNLIEAWSPFCVADQSYALLSLPRDAIFNMSAGLADTPSAPPTSMSMSAGSTAQPASDNLGPDACAELGIVQGRKLVACRGHGPARFTMTVTDRTGSQTFVVTLEACTNSQLMSKPAGTSSPVAAATLKAAPPPATSSPMPASTSTPWRTP
jgi:hypothetical protein